MDSNKPPDSTVPDGDKIPNHELALIRSRLRVASAAAYVCSVALEAQSANHEPEVAICLDRCVVDALNDLVDHITRLLREDGARP
jgi:hypothetical protein